MTSRLSTAALMICATLAVVAAQESAPAVYTPGSGVSLPTPIKQVPPQYTQEAKDARIEGTVLLECVVLADGTIGDVTVRRSLDSRLGLDQEAVKAMKQWQFNPGTKDGKPVAVRVQIESTFTLR